MVPEIKKILYAADLSKNALYAFGYAAELARQLGATIVILHVIEPASGTFGEEVKKMAEDMELESIIWAMIHAWQRYCESVDLELGCMGQISDVLVRVGHPVEEILKAAEQENCDMILLGNHGKGFLKQALLGSISHKILDRTLKPVVIVPLPGHEFEWDVSQWKSYKPVSAAPDRPGTSSEKGAARIPEGVK